MGRSFPSPLEKSHLSKGETPGNPQGKSSNPWTQRKGLCVAKEPVFKMHLAIVICSDLESLISLFFTHTMYETTEKG